MCDDSADLSSDDSSIEIITGSDLGGRSLSAGLRFCILEDDAGSTGPPLGNNRNSATKNTCLNQSVFQSGTDDAEFEASNDSQLGTPATRRELRTALGKALDEPKSEYTKNKTGWKYWVRYVLCAAICIIGLVRWQQVWSTVKSPPIPYHDSTAKWGARLGTMSAAFGVTGAWIGLKDVQDRAIVILGFLHELTMSVLLGCFAQVDMYEAGASAFAVLLLSTGLYIVVARGGVVWLTQWLLRAPLGHSIRRHVLR